MEFTIITVCTSLGQPRPNVHVMSSCYSLRQYFKASWCKSLCLKSFRGGGFCLRAWLKGGDSVMPFAEPCVPLQKAELAEPLEQLEQMSPSSAPSLDRAWWPSRSEGSPLAGQSETVSETAPQAVGCNHLSHWLPHQNPNKGIVYNFGVIFEGRLLYSVILLFCLPPCCSSPVWQKTLQVKRYMPKVEKYILSM